jgi:hypothetical protein
MAVNSLAASDTPRAIARPSCLLRGVLPALVPAAFTSTGNLSYM